MPLFHNDGEHTGKVLWRQIWAGKQGGLQGEKKLVDVYKQENGWQNQTHRGGETITEPHQGVTLHCNDALIAKMIVKFSQLELIHAYPADHTCSFYLRPAPCFLNVLDSHFTFYPVSCNRETEQIM